MAYSADTFVADEQPTTAKWNKLWANDAAFNDGTGIGDATIINRHLGVNAVAANQLTTSAIYLGSALSGSFSNTTATFADVTNGSITVTTPAGGRSVLILTMMSVGGTTSSLLDWRLMKDGGALSGGGGREPLNGTGGWTSTVTGWALDVAPTNASHTYKLQTANATAAGTISGTATLVLLCL